MDPGDSTTFISDSERLASLINTLNHTRGDFHEVMGYPVEDCIEAFGTNYSEVIFANEFNVTCILHAPSLNKSAITKSLILSVMAIFSLLGNLATMYSIRKSRRRTTGHIYSLLYHLSIADLCVTFWCIVGEAAWHLTVEWKAGVLECKIFKFAQMFSLYLSAYIMVLIGVDRFIAVKYPLKSMTKGMCFRLISVCWVLSAFLSLPQVIVFDVRRGPFQEEFYQCVTHGSYTADWQEHLYTFFTLTFTFIIPLIILASTYLLTVCTLHRNEEFLDHTGSFRTLIDPNRRKIIRRAKMKSLRISVAIVCVYCISWAPYYVAMIIYLFSEDKNKILMDSGDLLPTIIFFFGMSNSYFNPIIYGIFHLWKPRRKELQRGNSSRKTLLTNVSFQRHRSGTITNGVNGTLILHDLHTQNSNTEEKSPVIKVCLQQWIGNVPVSEQNTVL